MYVGRVVSALALLQGPGVSHLFALTFLLYYTVVGLVSFPGRFFHTSTVQYRNRRSN